MMRVTDLPGWVPQSGGSFSSRGGDVFALTADQVTIERVVRVIDEHVLFTCRFQGQSVYYDFAVEDVALAKKLAASLRANVGQILLSVGPIKIR